MHGFYFNIPQALTASRLGLSASRSLVTSSRLGVMSMKDEFSLTNNKGIYPSSASYERIRKVQSEWAVCTFFFKLTHVTI